MIKYIDNGDYIQDRETGATIPKAVGNRHYKQYLAWLDEGNEPVPAKPGPEYDLVDDAWGINSEKQKEVQIADINAAYKVAIAEPATCTVNGVDYIMDAQEDSAVKLRRGIEYAEKKGLTTLDVIDYYNAVHEGVSLADCEEIALQQAAAFFANYYARATQRAAVLNASE